MLLALRPKRRKDVSVRLLPVLFYFPGSYFCGGANPTFGVSEKSFFFSSQFGPRNTT